jgi:hypothetical protein
MANPPPERLLIMYLKVTFLVTAQRHNVRRFDWGNVKGK